ncbi:MAG: EpsG family protein [Bifidobacteriaceae bacterium]|nr:EpsG family protein [Bifidobacteriaceae bacterium]
MGSDTKMYALKWALPEIEKSSMGEIYQKGRWELGFALLGKLCALTPDPPRALVILSSLIIVGLSSFAIIRISSRPALAFVLLILSSLFYQDMQLMRQAIAYSIAQVALIPLLKRKYLPYFGLVLLAFFFHKSAFILAFVPLLIEIFRYWKSKILMSSAIIILLIVLFTPTGVFNFILSHAGYSNYLGTTYGGSNHAAPLLLLACFVSWLVSALMTRRTKHLTVSDTKQEEKVFISILLLGIVVCCLAWRMAILYRFTPYPLAMLIPLFTNQEKVHGDIRIRGSQFFLDYAPFIGLFVMYTFLVPSWTSVFPYSFM